MTFTIILPKHKLHIVSFDVPYPPTYGGVIDVFYKLKHLYEAGAEIYLHCFEYGRAHSEQLQQYCKEVWYYPRKTGVAGISLSKPYIINSRRSDLLLQRLIEINVPILFEGVHTTYYINHPSLANRQKAIRNHNVEWDYYRQLGNKESELFKKMFFRTESRLLKRYEEQLNAANIFLPLSISDAGYFEKLYPKAVTQFIAPFHPYEKVNSRAGTGIYCLYHGNLSHPENIDAALFLIQQVFNTIDTPLIIAGSNPDEKIVAACSALHHCQLVANPDDAIMQQLIQDAQIHVLPTFQPTGMKLKLLYALFNGRHVLVNDLMLNGTGLNDLCQIALTAQDFVATIRKLMPTPLTENDITHRNAALLKDYNNRHNAEKLLTYLQV